MCACACVKSANELLETEGKPAFEKAKERFDQYGQQSDQISEISREARAQVEELEKKADQSKQNALDAEAKASKAYDLAKNTMNQQQQIRYYNQNASEKVKWI